MEFSLDASDLDATCLMVCAWLVVALVICLWYLSATTPPPPEEPFSPEETDPHS